MWEPRAGSGPAGPHREWTAEPVSTGVSGAGGGGGDPPGGLQTRDGLTGRGGIVDKENPPMGGGRGLCG